MHSTSEFAKMFLSKCVSQKFASRLECNTGRQEDCLADGLSNGPIISVNVDDEA